MTELFFSLLILSAGIVGFFHLSRFLRGLAAIRLSRRFSPILYLALVTGLVALFSLLPVAYAASNDISGRVIKDVEGNSSISDPLDTPLEDVHVYLFRDTGDDVPNTGDTLVAWTLTDATGAYSFLGQPNGTYWVVLESDDINSLGTSVEQTYGGVGALVDPDANKLTAATPRITPGSAFGGQRMLVVDGFTTETQELDKAEHIIRLVLDGTGAGHTNLDFGFGFMKGLAAGYSEFYIPTQMVTTASWNEAPNAAFGSMAGGIWSILRDLDNDTALAGGMHYIISVAASTDNTTIYYDHWEDGYDFDPLNPSTADQTVVRNKGQVQIFESANIPHNPRNPANTFYDGRDRIVVAGGPAVVTLSIFPQTPGSVYNVAWEVLPIKPLQTNYMVPVGEGMAGNGAIDFEQTFLTIQSASDGNTITVDDPSEPGTPDLTVVLNRGQVLDVRHTAPGTIVTGTAPIQVQMIGGYYRAGGASEADGLTIFPKTLWDDEYYNPVESAGDATNDGSSVYGNPSLYATELYVYNPTANPITIFWQDTSGSGTYALPAYTSRAYSQMSGHFVPIGSAAYIKSMGGEKFWAIGEGGVSTNNVGGNTATTGDVHTYYDSGYSLVPGYLLRQDYYMAWAPGDSNTPSATNASSVYVTAVNNGTEIFIDFDGDGVADQTDFDNADGDNNPATGMESSYILNRLQSIQLRDPNNPYTLSGAHIWSNGPTAATWAPYPRTASYVTPSLDAGYSALPLPLEWMDAVLGILKSVDSGTFKPAVGQVATFTLSIPAYQAVEDVIATDTLPIGWNFSSGTSNVSITKNGVTTSSTANPTITGNGTTTRETLTWNFVTLLGPGMDDLDPNDYIVIKFTAVTNASVRTGYNQNDTDVCGTRTVSGQTQTFCAEDKLAVYVVPLSIDKDTTTPYVAAGGVATYTIAFQNTDTVNDLTSVRITDTLPAGFSYIAGSAIYTVTDNAPAGDTSPGNGVAPTTVPAGGATNLVWGNWTLGNGDRLTVTFRVTVSTLAGTYDNTATAGATLGGTRFTITDNGSTANDLGTPLNADPEEDEDVTVGLDLSGKAWLDNGAGGGVVYDGIRNGTESGYANIVVNLLDSTSTYVLQTMLTDVNGDYIFRGLAANTTYIVEFGTPPAGHFTTLQDQGSNNTVDSDVNPSTRRVTVPLTTTSVANIDAGFAPYASIGDYVWNDVNGNGIQDGGETGISGITVTLYLAATPVQTATTDASGLYTFTNVVSGTYSVQFTGPTTYTFSAVDQGGNDNLDNDADPATGRTATFTANAGQVITDVDAGLYQPATIGDSVWFDLNHDGLQNEVSGLAGITLTLTYPNGTVITTTTSSTGAYSFTVPSSQIYTITVAPANFAPGGPLAAYTATLSNQGDDALDSDGQPDGSGGVIFVTPVITQNNDTFDFGFFLPIEPVLTKAVSFTPGLTATLGTTVTYVIAVPDPAISRTLTSVVVTDTLNSALYPVTATVSGGLTPTVALNGQDVTATFGAITAGSQARITVTAIISDATITSGANIANSAVMTHAQAASLTTSNPVTTTIGEPSLTVDKSVASSGSLADVDGTTLLTYTIRLTNSGTSPAYSVRLTDAVPSGISVTNYLGSFPWSGPVVGPNTMTWTVNTIDNLSPNNVVVLTYTARLSGAIAGSSVTNLVTTTYHSLTDTVPGARPYGPLTDTTTITPARPNVVKTVTPSSSNISPLQIGDIITYTLVTTVPPGTSIPWPFQYDYLPVGFRYVTNTFTVTTNLPFSGVSLTDTLSLPLVSEGITGDIGVLGLTSTANPNVGARFDTPGQQALEWWLQPLNNGGRSTTGLITVTFQIQLIGLDLTGAATWTDQLVVDNGTNRSFLRWNLQDAGRYTTTVPVDSDASSQPTTYIAQPNLTLDKHSLPVPDSTVDPGDTITYTLTITNNGLAPAYDLVLTDTLLAGLTYQNTISNPAAGVAITATPSGQLITYTVNQLAAGPGASMVITLVAQVDPSITGGIILTNTASLPYYDSQPGDGPGVIPPTQRTYTDGSDSVSHPVAIVPGLTLDPDHTATVPPGQTITYTHVLTNEGNATDTFTLTVTSVGPFPVTDDIPPSITLTAGQTVAFVITVTVPAGASATDQGVTVITATSSLSPSLSATDTDTTNTAIVPGLTLDPDHTATVQPGQVVTYTHVLTNEGNATDTFTLTVTSTGPFPVTDDLPPAITLTAGQTATFVITVTVPAGASATDQGVTIITATSSLSPSLSAVDTDTTNTAVVSGLTLDPDHTATVPPGQVVTYTHVLTNEGNATDTFTLTVTSVGPFPTVDNIPPAITLAAGQTATFVITVTVPAGANATDQGVTVITATSTLSPALQAVDTDTTNTAVVPGLSLDPDHTQTVPPGQVVTYTHVLTNEGNATDTFALTVTSVGPFPVTDDIPPTITLTAGQTATFVITVTVPAGASATDQGVTVITATSTLSPVLQVTDTDTTNTAVVPGLSLDPDHTATVQPGQVVTYTHVLTNEGNATDTFTLTVTSTGPFPVTDDIPPTITLTAGQTATFVITVTVPAGASATDQGVTVITATSTISPALQVTDTDTTHVELADVTIVKTDDPDPVAAGGILTYTLVYTNNGSTTAQNVEITDTLPAGVAFGGVVSTNPTLSAPTGAGQTRVWTVGTLASGSSGSIVFTVTVDSNTSGVITNSVTITTSTPDSNPNNNNDDEPTEVGRPGLSITKTRIGGSPVLVGQPVQFQIVVENTGNTDLTTVTLVDTYDTAHLAYNGATPVSDDNNNDGVLTWANLGPITVGGRVTVTVNFTATASTQALLNGVTINAARALATDTNGTPVLPVNDTDTVGVINPGLAVDKSINIARVAPHQIVTYTITITNVGDVTLNPVRVTDTLDAGLTLIPGTANPAPSAVNGQQLVWNDVTSGAGLAPHARTQITLLVSVPTITGTYGNLVVTTGDHPAGTTRPVTDRVSTHVEDPSIQVDKELNAPGVVGDLITFTIRITNTGPSVLDQIPLFDSFTGPVQYVGGTPRADTVDNTNRRLAWNDLTTFFGDLAPGQSAALVTVFRLTTTDSEFSMTNTARVTHADDVFNNVANEDEDTEILTNVPTAVDLLYFTSQQAGNNVELLWATAVEYDNFGFLIKRSSTGSLADAVEIGFVPGQGHGTVSGTTYDFTDNTVEVNQTYTYWLVDVDLNGVETPHSETTSISVTAGGSGTKLYLPRIFK